MFDRAAAADEVRRLREQCGLLGAFLLVLAVEQAGAHVRRLLDELTADAFREAWRRATAAAKRATWAVERVEELERRVRELEQRKG